MTDVSSIWQMFSTAIGSAAVIAAVSVVFFSSKKRSELHRKNKTLHSLLMAVVFGLLSVYASVSAVEVNGLLCNCRNLAPLYAGMVGGPIAGVGAALIGGVFRHVVYGGPAGVSCMLACFLAGIIGSVIHLTVKKPFRYRVLTGAVAAIVVELLHFFIALAFGLGDTAKLLVGPATLSNLLGTMFCLYIYSRFDRSAEQDRS